jgi:hypothetical protein
MRREQCHRFSASWVSNEAASGIAGVSSRRGRAAQAICALSNLQRDRCRAERAPSIVSAVDATRVGTAAKPRVCCMNLLRDRRCSA